MSAQFVCIQLISQQRSRLSHGIVGRSHYSNLLTGPGVLPAGGWDFIRHPCLPIFDFLPSLGNDDAISRRFLPSCQML